MAHARVSPTFMTDTMVELQSLYSDRILACAEVLRVNTYSTADPSARNKSRAPKALNLVDAHNQGPHQSSI